MAAPEGLISGEGLCSRHTGKPVYLLKRFVQQANLHFCSQMKGILCAFHIRISKYAYQNTVTEQDFPDGSLTLKGGDANLLFA